MRLLKIEKSTLPIPPVVTRRFIDGICEKISKGGIQAEIDLILMGFTRAEVANIKAQVSKRLKISSVGMSLMEIEGVPVYGDCGW